MKKKTSASVQKFFRDKMPPEVLEYFREQGRKGGKIGGKRSLETMTPQERHERARKAAARSAEVRTRRRKLREERDSGKAK